MANLLKSIWPYFEAMANGLEALLPVSRIQNRALLLDLLAAWEAQQDTTSLDLEHLKIIMAMADQVAFPPFEDVKTFCEAEAFLFQSLTRMGKLEIQLSMRWMLLLLARHGRLNVDLSTLHDWLPVWRMVQALPSSDKSFMEAFIGWLEGKKFSPHSMRDILRESRKLKAWMAGHGLTGLGEIGNLELQRFLLSRACGYKNSSKQQILGRLRPLLHYYQEAVDGCYRVPDYTVKVPQLLGVNESASDEEIDRLLEALQGKELPAMAGLMLICVIGYGLTLRKLPLLELTGEPGALTYRERLPCRKGTAQRFISLDLSVPWIAEYWRNWLWERGESSYLYSSGHGQKRMKPASVIHCQRHVQAAVQEVLGYPLAVNHLERGALKRLAGQTSITQFMALTSEIPKSRLSRMMVWLTCQQGRSF